MNRISLAAMSAVLLAAGQVHAQAAPLHIQIAPGQSFADALHAAQLGRDPAAMARRSTSPAAASINPTILGGAVTTGTITVGVANSLPVIQFTYKAKNAGLNAVYFTFTSPNGQNTLAYSYHPRTYVTGGKITFSPDSNAPFYAQPGQWALTSVEVVDNDYNFTLYTQAQSAALFAKPYLTVVNTGAVDITPPVVKSGAILTPKVSRSSPVPEFVATLTGTDDVSGIDQAYVLIQPPGSMYSQVDQFLAPFPTLNGTVTAYSNVYSDQPTGTWTITGYVLCDVVANCFTDTNAADVQALFGTTTFTVTP